MKSLRTSALTLLVMLLLLVSASSAYAGGPVTVTQETFEGPVEWTMPGSCMDVPVQPLSGTGDIRIVTITRVSADGATTVQSNAVANGSASDSTGTYRWQYNNELTETVPAASSTHQVHMIDSFVLNGNGSAKLSVSFNWRWTYAPPAGQWPPVDNWEQLSTNGDPFNCDPL